MASSKSEKFGGGEEIPESIKQGMDGDFREHLLSSDAGNSLAPASIFAHMGTFENITPIQTYEQYFEEKAAGSPMPEVFYKYVMDNSDPALVKEYNARVRAFNEDLDRIKREKDNKKAQEFFQGMYELLRTKRNPDK